MPTLGQEALAGAGALWPAPIVNGRARVVYEADRDYHARYDRALSATGMRDNPMRRLRFFGIAQAVAAASRVPGDAIEAGCFRGLSAWLACDAFRRAGRQVAFHLCDSFEGLSDFTGPDLAGRGRVDEAGTKAKFACPEEAVRRNLSEFDFVRTHKGWIPAPFASLGHDRFCYAHIDVDLYEPTRDSLAFIWPRMNLHGVVVFDDYGTMNFPGARKAIDEFYSDRTDYFLVEHPAGQATAIKLS